MAGAIGVHGHNVLILAPKNTQTSNQHVRDIGDVIHLCLGWVANHVSVMKSNSNFVVCHFVLSMEDGQSGIHGVRVRQLVEVGQKFVQEIVTIHRQVMEAIIVTAIIAILLFARFNLVLVSVLFKS